MMMGESKFGVIALSILDARVDREPREFEAGVVGSASDADVSVEVKWQRRDARNLSIRAARRARA